MTLAFPIGHFGIFCPSGRVFGDKPLGWVGNSSHSAAIIPTTFWGESPPRDHSLVPNSIRKIKFPNCVECSNRKISM